MRLRTLVALLAAVLLAWPAAAQEQRGSIEGVVKDTSGAILPGVTVSVTGGSGVKLDTVSDAAGGYRFPSLQPGTYTVAADLQGFAPGKVADVLVALGQVKKVDFALQVASVSETVQVTAESPLVDVKSTARGTNIRAEEIDLLPHDRNFTSLVTQAPGANNEPKSGGIMIDGSSAAENRYIVDGMETTDMVHGQSGKNVLADFIEEVQVKSSGYPAEYGGSTGGVINVITKSGTNNLNGNIVGYWQGSSVQGDSNPTLRLKLTDSSQAEYITYPKDPYNRFEPGGALGGPILRNKSWFFAAYQPAYTKTDRTVLRTADSQTITKTQNEEVQYLTANQTMQLGEKLRTRVAYNNSWSKRDGQLPSQNGSDNPLTDYTKGTKFPNYTISGNADYIISPKLFLGIRAGYFNNNTNDYNVPNVSKFNFGNTTNIGLPNVPADEQHPTGYTNVLSNTAVDHDLLTRKFFQADATWYTHFGGDHQIKGGVQVDHRGEDILSGELAHRVTLNWGQQLPNGSPLKSGPYGYYSVRSNALFPKQGLVTTGDVQSNLTGLFVQDSYTATSRLTINAGVRTENEKVPAYTDAPGVAAYPISFGFKDKIAPRAGFAYDVKGDGRWKAYGSWGIFYDIFKLELPQGSFGGQKWLEYYYTLDTPDFESLDQGPQCPPQCSGTFIAGPTDFRAVSVTPGQDIESNLKPMRSQEAAFGLEHQLNNVMAVSARYIHKQVDRAIEDTGSRDPVTFSETYIIANPGEGLTQLAFAGVDLPKPKREYNGVEFVFDKRFADDWSFRASYLLSRDYGNYPGLSESDENGRSDPNVGRLYDYPLIMFKADGTPSFGPLPTDRTHQFKLNGLYRFRFGTAVGVNEYIQSGIPITPEIAVLPNNNYPMQWLGRGGAGRMDWYTQTDLFVQHEFSIGGNRKIQLNANVLNLFDQRSVQNTFITRLNGAGIIFDEGAFYAGQVNFDQAINSAVAAGSVQLDPRYLQANGFEVPLQARFGVKLLF